MKKFLLLLSLWFCACSPKGPHKNIAGQKTQGDVGYDQVRPIFARHCASCHPSRSAPDWLDYDQAHTFVQNGRLERRVVLDRSMPPPSTAEAATLTEKDRMQVAQWIQGGGKKNSSEGPAERGSASSNEANATLQKCFQCHGVDGPRIEADPKVPRLSGQNRDYLVRELRRFKWRERIDPSERMNEAALPLTEEEIIKTADYFAKKPPLIGHAKTETFTQQDRVRFDRGRKLAERSCNGCHMNGDSRERPSLSLIPALRGQSRTYLINQLLYFRGGERQVPLMQTIAADLSQEDIDALAFFYSQY